jgi:hypothetical protein
MAEIPSAEAFAADSGHWNIAVSALIRAVVLDRVPVTDPLVTKVIRLLGPAVDAEVRHAASDGRGSQLGGKSEGNPLDFLISEKAIEPADALTIGLAVLATLADLCRTAEASVLAPC